VPKSRSHQSATVVILQTSNCYLTSCLLSEINSVLFVNKRSELHCVSKIHVTDWLCLRR